MKKFSYFEREHVLDIALSDLTPPPFSLRPPGSSAARRQEGARESEQRRHGRQRLSCGCGESSQTHTSLPPPCRLWPVNTNPLSRKYTAPASRREATPPARRLLAGAQRWATSTSTPGLRWMVQTEAAAEGRYVCLVCTGSDGGRPSSLLLLPEEGDGEPGPADGPQSSEDEEAGEGDPTAG